MSIIPIISATYALPYEFIYAVLILLSIPFIKSSLSIESTTIIGLTKKAYLLLVLFIFLGLRGFLQTDFLAYHKYFQDVPTIWENKSITDFLFTGKYKDWEKGFLIFSIFSKSILPNYFFLQALSFLVDFILIYYFFDYYVREYLFLSFAFFFVFSGLEIEINLLRNSKSICLFLFSIRYLDKKNYAIYFLINTIGFFFHSSALVYLFFGFFLRLKFSRKLIITIIFTGIVFFIFRISIISIILSFLGDIVPGRLGLLIRYYLESNKSTVGLSIGFIERLFTAILLLCFYRFMYENTRKRIIGNALAIYLCTYFYGFEVPIVYQRLGALFVFSYWIFYPLIYQRLSKEKKILFMAVFTFYALLKIYSGFKYSLFYYDNLLSLNMLDYEQRKNIVFYYKQFEAQMGWSR